MKHNHVGIDVSAKTFTTIIDYEGERTKDMDVRQGVAHAGIDPMEFQSDTSIDKPSRISRRGNVHLR
jgi:hypothetical protein